MKSNFLIVIIITFVIIIGALFLRTLFVAHDVDQALENARPGDTITIGMGKIWFNRLKEEVKEIVSDSQEKIERGVSQFDTNMQVIDQQFVQAKNKILSTATTRVWEHATDSVDDILQREQQKMAEKWKNSLSGTTIRVASYPNGFLLTDHIVCDLTEHQLLFLVNKNVSNEDLTLALQKLANFTFTTRRYGRGTTVFPVFWNSKEVDGVIVGLTLELKLPNGEEIYIMKQRMLSDQIVGFAYNSNLDELIIYQ